MTFIDTDIFVIDKLFLKDDRYEINKGFLNFQDAVILMVAEQHHCTRFVTWNTKHFGDRTYMSVQTPKEFLGVD